MQDGGRTVHVLPLSEDAVSLLLLLGMHAYHDPELLTQLARIFRHIILANTVLFASPATIGEAYERSCMVSSVQAIKAPCPIAHGWGYHHQCLCQYDMKGGLANKNSAFIS